MNDINLKKFAPFFQADHYSEDERKCLAPFFTNLDKSVYAMLILSPELAGALCSRMSRAAQDIRQVYLHEFIEPFINPIRTEKDTDETLAEKIKYGADLKAFIDFLQDHSMLDIFSNPRARSFYTTWLAQYGDDSIAQMAGAHLAFCGISQIAIKHIEDQRIGIAPIEKSTRYVNYSKKVDGRYLYYTDPTLEDLGLKNEYERAMDGLFDAYSCLIPKMIEWLSKHFPEEKPTVVEKKAFDTLRGLLPTSTLSQVSFFGNGQAFEYMIARSNRHTLGEIRWVANRTYEELNQVTPSFLRRLRDESKKEVAEVYQTYLAKKQKRMLPHIEELFADKRKKSAQDLTAINSTPQTEVKLMEHDLDGESKIITGMLYSAPTNHQTWSEIFNRVKNLSHDKKREIIESYMQGRTQRWQRVGRALENTYVRWEIVMNIGGWRDLHRHRMLTQQRQHFSCYHGYDIPNEISESELEPEFRQAIAPVEDVFHKIARRDPDLAQYAVTLAHRLRFMQWENLRQSFWQIELRTIPEGHPDYRHIAQEKFLALERIYPLVAKHMFVNLGQYDFARRGQEEKIKEKLKKLM